MVDREKNTHLVPCTDQDGNWSNAVIGCDLLDRAKATDCEQGVDPGCDLRVGSRGWHDNYLGSVQWFTQGPQPTSWPCNPTNPPGGFVNAFRNTCPGQHGLQWRLAVTIAGEHSALGRTRVVGGFRFTTGAFQPYTLLEYEAATGNGCGAPIAFENTVITNPWPPDGVNLATFEFIAGAAWVNGWSYCDKWAYFTITRFELIP